MEKINIQDGSNDKMYFTIIPNYVLNHSTHWDREVYSQMKRIAGETGTCWTSRNKLAKQCGISLTRLKKSIKYLLDKGWIKKVGEKKIDTRGGDQYVNEYEITDLWKLNNDFYNKGGSSENPPYHKGGSRNSQRGVAKVPKGGSSENPKEEPIKKNKEKEKLTPKQKMELFISSDKSFNEISKAVAKLYNLTQSESMRILEEFRDYWTNLDQDGEMERWRGDKFFNIDTKIRSWINISNKGKSEEIPKWAL